MRTLADCDSDMLAGYWDGLTANDDHEPGANHSHSYRHGWRNGRDDRNKSPRSTASYVREEADKARAADMNR